MGLFNSLISLTGNVAKVVLAPVEIIIGVADAAIQPAAEAAKDLVDDVKSLKD